MHGTAVLLVGFAIGVLIPSPASAQDASAFYEANCAACHTIGGGPQAGPDLKGVTARRDRDWLIRFLAASGVTRRATCPRRAAASDRISPPRTNGSVVQAASRPGWAGCRRR